jgi:tetratricopeptide (TPR) repeat protein
MVSGQVDRTMTWRYTGQVAWRLAAISLIFCLMVPGAFAQEKLKSVWVKADELLTQEKYEEAVKLYSIAIEMNLDDPDIYNAYFHRGQAFIHLGKVDEALADYTESLRINPAFPNAYKLRGIIYLQTDRYAEALSDFSRFIELKADTASGYANRGIALEQLGNFEKALSDFNKSIELDPACAECYYNRYNLFTVMGRDSEAELDLKKAQSLDSRYKGDN